MITREQALNLRRDDELHYGECTRTVGPRGGVRTVIETWRVNGMAHTWKTRPWSFEVSIKYGFRSFGYLSSDNANLFHLAQECPLLEAEAVSSPEAEDSTRPWS